MSIHAVCNNLLDSINNTYKSCIREINGDAQKVIACVKKYHFGALPKIMLGISAEAHTYLLRIKNAIEEGKVIEAIIRIASLALCGACSFFTGLALIVPVIYLVNRVCDDQYQTASRKFRMELN